MGTVFEDFSADISVKELVQGLLTGKTRKILYTASAAVVIYLLVLSL